MTDFVLSLVVTIIVEFTILWALSRRPVLAVLTCSALVNAFTQPLATYLYEIMPNKFLAIEGRVVLVESVLIAFLLKLKYGRAFLLSLAANFATAAIGILWFHYHLFPAMRLG